jgi:hypothetical protein
MPASTSGARRFGPQAKPLAALSDAELLDEVQQRRRRRGVEAEATTPAVSATRSQIAKHLASLELKADATLEQVDSGYARLHAKYSPFLEADNAERRAAAKRLLDSLEHAYRELKAHLKA